MADGATSANTEGPTLQVVVDGAPLVAARLGAEIVSVLKRQPKFSRIVTPPEDGEAHLKVWLDKRPESGKSGAGTGERNRLTFMYLPVKGPPVTAEYSWDPVQHGAYPDERQATQVEQGVLHLVTVLEKAGAI